MAECLGEAPEPTLLTIIGVIPIDRVRAAAERARPHVLRSPLIPVEGAQLKLECLQPTGSFKVRGFFSAALALPPDRLRRGLITVSAGNAAQACAYVARQLGVPCRVFMYDTAPPPKSDGVRRLGGTVIGMPRDELIEWMTSEQWRNEPEAFIHGFADPDVIAGHGGIGLELLEDVPNLERVVVPVGGGGLISGIASALKGIHPDVEVVGVQSDGYPLWQLAFESGGAVAPKPDTIADGTTAPFDPRMFELLKECVDRWLIVSEPRLKAAIPEIAATAKVVAEGAGALAYAALEQLQPGPTTVAVVSGGNIDPTLLATLLS
ncbi:MAG: pyridoxal-phosphate dependent enzyme [Chloroflexi bacterium]|nr:MAG: pyridoxal-phosphate dependent enzyme [Chloroflexota bacterium]